MKRFIFITVQKIPDGWVEVIVQLYGAQARPITPTVWQIECDFDDELDGAALKDLLEEDFAVAHGVCELSDDQPYDAALIAQALTLAPKRFYDIETLYLKAVSLDRQYETRFKQWLDQTLSQHLIQTALAFAAHQMNVSQTAQVLFLHRNSMHYRLSQIKAQCGLDPYRFETLALLHRLYSL